MIYVSRYSNPELRTKKYTAVSISVGFPKWPLGYEINGSIKDLMPFGLLNISDKEEYEKKYRARLDKCGVDNLRTKLKAFSGEKDIVLLCYEDIRDVTKWCHRTMFSHWWNEHTGEIISELKDPSICNIKNKSQKNHSEREEDKLQNLIKARKAELAQTTLFDI